jgi:LysM repeat protein
MLLDPPNRGERTSDARNAWARADHEIPERGDITVNTRSLVSAGAIGALLLLGGCAAADPSPAEREAVPVASPAPAASPEATPSTVHVVQRGDTLSAIAATYGVTVGLLIQANQLANPDRLEIGQMLVVPSTGRACDDIAAITHEALHLIRTRAGAVGLQDPETLLRDLDQLASRARLDTGESADAQSGLLEVLAELSIRLSELRAGRSASFEPGPYISELEQLSAALPVPCGAQVG